VAQERKNDFTKGSIPRNIMNLAVPLTVAQLTVVLYNIVDRAFIGHIDAVGKDAFTAVGLAMPVVYVITAFANLAGMGGAPLFSIERGRGNDARAGQIMGNAFVFLLLLGVLLMVVGYTFLTPILYLVGGSDVTVGYAKEYLQIYLAGTIPVMLALGMNPFINAQGFGRTGMMTVVLGAGINIVLDPVFIFLLDMGVAGAAWATVVSQCCSALWVLWFLGGKKALLRLERATLGFHLPTVAAISSLGLTGFTFGITNSLVQAVGNAMLQSCGAAAGGAALGDLYVGAMTAINSVREIIFQPIRGLTQGAQPVIGYNYGAGMYSRVRESIRFVTKAVLAYNVLIWLLVLAVPHLFILLFNDDPALLEVGTTAMRIYFAAYFMMSFQCIGQNTFVGLGHAKKAVFFSLLRKVILVVPLMLMLPRLLGAAGVFAAEPISDVVGGTLCYVTMLCTVGREMKRPDEPRDCVN